MLFAGNLGAEVSIENLPGTAKRDDYKLFSESNGRWLVEVKPENAKKFEALFKDVTLQKIGETADNKNLIIYGENQQELVYLSLKELHHAWHSPIYKIEEGEE